MAWFPRYEITAGLLAGKASPAGGSLQGLYDFPSVSRQQSGNVRFAQRYDFANDAWEGAYGTACLTELLAHAKASVESGNLNQWYLLAEIEVENPEGAQYYKQSYVIEAMDTSSCRFRQNSVTYQDMEYTCKWFEAQWSFRVSRYQYDTPYSGYTRTDLTANTNRSFGVGCEITEESISDAAYYAFTGGWVWDRVLLSLGSFISSDNKDCFGVAMYGTRDYPATYRNPHPNPSDRKSFAVVGQTIEWLNTLYGGEFKPEEKEDPNDEDPPEDGPGKGGGGGGEGDHNLPNEPVLIPPLPEIGVASVNWLTVYKMTLNQVNSFGQAMLDPTGWDALKQFFNNPLEAIVNLILVPASAPTAGARTPVVGRGAVSYSWPEAYPIIHEEFAEIDCGVIMVKPYWDSAFDFDPYTRIEIFLPFLGFKQIKADDVMGSRVQVKYHVNVMTGEFTAFVSRTAAASDIYGIMAEQVIGEYNGNMGMRVPIGRNSSDAAIDASMRLMSNALGITAGAALGAALGDPMNVSASQAGSQIASATMTAVTGPKNHIERSGALGGGSGYLGNMKPFIVRSIPRQFMPKNYRMLEGYPANIGGTLGHYTGTGYQAVESIQLDGLNAYDSEINEIVSLLKGGVLV